MTSEKTPNQSLGWCRSPVARSDPATPAQPDLILRGDPGAASGTGLAQKHCRQKARAAATLHGEEPAKRLALHSASPFSKAHAKPQLFWVGRKAPEEWGVLPRLSAAEGLAGEHWRGKGPRRGQPLLRGFSTPSDTSRELFSLTFANRAARSPFLIYFQAAHPS